MSPEERTRWDVDPDQWEHTPPLRIFRELMDEDDNLWWRAGSGHGLNAYEAAVEALDAASPPRCGGCQGLGSHRRYCPHHPAYHPWAELADRAESIGDSIGGNDPGLANRGYALAGAIRAAMPDHPWRAPSTHREGVEQ